MNYLSTIFLTAIVSNASIAQTTDLVVFSDDATKFTLIVDGDIKNSEPMTRVVATGIRTETPRLIVRFADAAIPQISKPLYFEMGMEYTLMLTTNKKGERVLRPSGQAPLGTASAGFTTNGPIDFQDDPPSTGTTNTTLPVDPGPITTTTVVEEVNGSGEGADVRMNVSETGFNVSMKVDGGSDGVNSTTTTRTTTTTTTTRTTEEPTLIIDRYPVPVEPAPTVYDMPGYTGRHGCNWPMSSTEFNDVKMSLESKSFEETKMTMAKQVGSNRCFTVDQVKGVMGLFSFEDSKLDFAKYAYERTFDIDNYFKVNDAFTFESSVDELNSYIQAR